MSLHHEEEIYARQGFGAELGIVGQVGLLLIDFVNGFADPAAFGGGNIGPAIENSRELLAQARQRGFPVAHSRIVYADDGADANIFSLKVPSLLGLTETSHGSQIVDALAPVEGELIVRKTTPSAFFGTGLAPWLTAKSVSTLLVGGCVTSGCVRASVIDAMCHGFRPVVVEDCVGDRAIAPHEANLFDMRQKCGDVLPLAAVLQRLDATQGSG
ncbi:N-carbamoylsarcosine amidase [Sphingomonas oleivorans]|uniref:N-carbamoylsarcosine amidase n=1 Tax=Sphingomonas oleivorans TaxID=1735121 RepID=A0A2T5FU10_9SPHN|nr:isochorismatase family protein [Sphingomonas oleivorans]PTQ07772.1 N-carbamoylsarcosine amidase [Sphingomonas oleivorans]